MDDDKTLEDHATEHDFSDFDDFFAPEELEDLASDHALADTVPDLKENAPSAADPPLPNTDDDAMDIDLDDLADLEQLLADDSNTETPKPTTTDNDAIVDHPATSLTDDLEIDRDLAPDDAIEDAASDEHEPPATDHDLTLDDDGADHASLDEPATDHDLALDDGVDHASLDEPATDHDLALDDGVDHASLDGPTTDHDLALDNDPEDDLPPQIQAASTAHDEETALQDSPDSAPDSETDEAIENFDDFDDFVIENKDEPDHATASEAFGDAVMLEPTANEESEALLEPTPAPAEPTDDLFDEKIEPEPGPINPAEEMTHDEPIPHDFNTPNEPTEEEDEDMKPSIIALIAGAVALIASMGSLWMGYSAKSAVAHLPAPTANSSVMDGIQIKAIQHQMGGLDERLKKLSTQLASQGGMTSPSNNSEVEALTTRTTRLEQIVSDIKEQIGHLRNSPPQPSVAPVSSMRSHAPLVIKAATPTHRPIRHRRHGWFVNLTSHTRKPSANHQIQQLKKLDIQAESKRVVVKGRRYYRVRIPGFSSKAKATAFKKMLATKHHITDSWVSNK
ncbi:MAG: SPOR domain-containing protein [Mariprofundales bacterium]|nr:SPOR domain-containing protein [Mariprofundales bacterium]